MENLPNDVMILYSFLNMKLRDKYSSFDELCDDMQIDRKEIETKLEKAGFEYNPELNKFW